jgi:glycosyltransferase involved in cell wall biosynthesis
VTRRVAVIVPVYGNAPTLQPLAERLATALRDRAWRLRLVIDASPDGSLAVAGALAAADPRIAVTGLAVNVGQHAALARGLAAEPDADAWVCLDADLQDPPEAVPMLLDRLAAGDVGAVFAGRRGHYESPVRRLTGSVHRWLAARLTGLPPDAGAFFAMDARVRAAVLAAMTTEAAPSVVLGVARAGVPVASVPVERDRRPVGSSAWTGRTRLRQSARSLVWALQTRR